MITICAPITKRVVVTMDFISLFLYNGLFIEDECTESPNYPTYPTLCVADYKQIWLLEFCTDKLSF